jgi:nucleoid-associated protein YgaU
MKGVFRGIRLVTGVTLVAAGMAMAAPRIQGVLHGQAPMLSMAAVVAPAVPAAVVPHAIPDPVAPVEPPPAVEPEPVVEEAASLPPPDPLPPSGGGVAGPPPLDMAYRSTLALPPPPLLDVAPPPPATGPVLLASAGPGADPRVALERPAAVASDVIRDGDDLTTIAVRVYGHPGAAAAILAANRDRIGDPAMLPVGVPLRLPPVWHPQGAAPPANPVIAPPQRPARVVVGPGESFESLARRFYGDPRYAGMLFEANRDLVRSPALLTQGTELRLP